METKTGLRDKAGYRPRPSRSLDAETNELAKKLADDVLSFWLPICAALGGAKPWAPLNAAEVERAPDAAGRDRSPRARASGLALGLRLHTA